jgi:large subunit ribosomal protein L10
MTREEKAAAIGELTEKLQANNVIYLADISGLNAADTTALRRLCYSKNISMSVVKNTLLRKAMEQSEKNFDELYPVLKGNTSIMIAEAGNAPAKLIQSFRTKKQEKPILKGAFIEEAIYIGDNQLETLSNIKSREELIGDIIMLLQSPAKNVVSALKSSGGTIAGLLKTLEERAQ